MVAKAFLKKETYPQKTLIGGIPYEETVKKIVALLLAGAMAMVMLTACGAQLSETSAGR